jgi:transposase
MFFPFKKSEYTRIKTSELEEIRSALKQLQEENAELKEELQRLKNQTSKNSKNSSKPPSSDGLKKTKSLRKKSTKKSGGQKGHPGHRLNPVSNPDHQLIHSVNECSTCQNNLQEIEVVDYDIRQVFDIPPLEIEVTEHCAEIKNCPVCDTINRASFPSSVTQETQYGLRLKALTCYLTNYQYLSLERTRQFFKDLFNHTIAEGTILKTSTQLVQQTKKSAEAIFELLVNASVVHFDESGLRVEGKLHWLHVASTKFLSYYQVHQRRGQEAFDDIGILPLFNGTAIHDHWKSYFNYDCFHGLCNAHHLRELLFISESYQQKWATQMSELLLEMLQAVDKAKLDQTLLSPVQRATFEKRYEKIIQKGRKANPKSPPPKKKKRGRPKQTPPQNLLDRLNDKKQSVLAFLYDFAIPFSNNQAEQDVRMIKVKQKISGTFRSFNGAENFAHVRSYISTARKNDIPILDAITQALDGDPYIPNSAW